MCLLPLVVLSEFVILTDLYNCSFGYGFYFTCKRRVFKFKKSLDSVWFNNSQDESNLDPVYFQTKQIYSKPNFTIEMHSRFFRYSIERIMKNGKCQLVTC